MSFGPFLLSLVALASATCPFGAEFFEGTGKCYLSSKLNAHWTASESICNRLGGHLVTIQDAKENDFVYKAASKLGSNIWLGAHYVNTNLVSTDGVEVYFTNFQKGMFSNVNGTVVVLNAGNPLNVVNNGKWSVSQDSENITLPFVCELPACNDGKAPPSLLKIGNKDTGLRYGPVTRSWYYGNKYDSATFQQAAAACASVAGRLPTVTNVFHNVEVVLVGKEFGLSRPLPIGLHSSVRGKWSWDDGTNTTYSNWARTFPLINNDQRAVLSLDDTFWRSSSLFDLFPKKFVCQLPVNRPKTCKN